MARTWAAARESKSVAPKGLRWVAARVVPTGDSRVAHWELPKADQTVALKAVRLEQPKAV